MNWIKEMFGTEKAIIGMLHLKALPGDPFYEGSMEDVILQAREDLDALQEGGVDGILVTNEMSLPYEKKVGNVTTVAMARVTGNNCMFPVIDGKIVCGGAQEIYLVDFDGPQLRTVYVEVMGEV